MSQLNSSSCSPQAVPDVDSSHAAELLITTASSLPTWPGVILVETMAQAGVVALGLFLASEEMTRDEFEKLVTVFTDANVEFSGSVQPGDRVTTIGRKVFFRRRKLRAEVEMKLDDGTVVCSGTLSGMGIAQ